MPIDVRPIESHNDFRAFFEFPWELYKDNPNWIPPLVSMRRDLLDKKKNPAWRYMDGQYLGAWQDGQLVGTITAYVNHRHNDYWGEHIGWFGTFELYDDQSIANALLDTASEWVKSRGYDAIRGPQSFTTHEETGLLVRNFSKPVLMMPYNPPYYEMLLQTAGFEKTMDIVSFYMDRELIFKSDSGERLKRIAEYSAKRSNVTIRTFDPKRKVEEFQLIRDMYNDVWDKNWGFVPMTDEELDALVESLGMFIVPEMTPIAEVNGEAVGFALAVPDLNELFHKVYPRPGIPEPITLIKLLYYWKIAKIVKGTRLVFLGVRKDYQDRGIDVALLHAVFSAIDPMPYTHIDCGWVLETNELTKISRKLGADEYKTHRYYEKRF